MADFLDVLHALFEESGDAPTQEARQARETTRKNIYMDLYGYKTYEWVSEDSQSASDSSWSESDMLPDEATGTKSSGELIHKPYVAPTPMDVDSPLPIAGLKEAPLG